MVPKWGGVNRMFYFYHFLLYKRLCFKLHWYIKPGTVGSGIHAYHIGEFVHIGDNVRIGKNFTFNPGVVFDAHKKIVVGDNVTMHLGVKIIKDVRIGNNVEIGANAVVTHDIPDNAVVAGVPARIIRIKNE